MRIGILGGGQLARMIMESCYKFGFEFHILSKEPNSPAGQLTNFETTGDWNDEKCLKTFGDQCDILILENEFIDSQKIKFLECSGKNVYPSSKIIKLIQDKLFQKETLERIGVPVAPFAPIVNIEDVMRFAEQNNYPLILKSRTMGYDGKGNITIHNEAQINEALDILSKRGELLCEGFIRFDKEIATQVVRNKNGEIKVYPVVETIQKDHICNLVIASKNLFDNIKTRVCDLAKNIVTELDYIGVMGIEMFLTGDEILVNELAPRVHNSGHYTIEGCYTSQFENQIRAVMNFPLGNTEMSSECAVMINILGKKDGAAKLYGAGQAMSNSKTYLHIYGKQETRKGRKMGHVTVLHNDVNEALKIAGMTERSISI
ncbi:MAG: 5-(carboxyamino)imidazole ribonucleotide synthase [Ignavibacteria bacterium]